MIHRIVLAALLLGLLSASAQADTLIFLTTAQTPQERGLWYATTAEQPRVLWLYGPKSQRSRQSHLPGAIVRLYTTRRAHEAIALILNTRGRYELWRSINSGVTFHPMGAPL